MNSNFYLGIVFTFYSILYLGDNMNSIWTESSTCPSFSKLQGHRSSDVCIIGGGITGLSLAYLLAKHGVDVCLLERDTICSGVTANTTGKLTSQHGLFYQYLVNTFGKDTAISYLRSNENAISSIKDIIDREQIDCDFEWQDAFVYTNNEEQLQNIRIEVETMKSLGFDASFRDNLPLPFKTLGGICFPHQAQFHARKYCFGLAKALPRGTICENSKAVDVERVEDRYRTICDDGSSVTSSYVVIASHYPILNFPGFYFLKMYQDKSYLIAVDTKKELFPGMYISAEEPVTSFRTAMVDGKRLLLVGGSGHKTGDTSIDITSCFRNLENYVTSLCPKADILYRWSTEDCVTLDKIPYIGKFSNLLPNVFVATGFKKWGMTSSFVAANSIYHQILDIPDADADIYKATRFAPIQNGNETGNILKQTAFSLFLNKIKAPVLSFEDLKVGEGGVVSYHGKKLGIYRKSKEETIAIKPYCTHLGCELSWNPLEKTWDCPCHGSRYDYSGKLLTEPSKKDLDRVNLSDYE